MIQINKKHIATLLLQPILYLSATAEESPAVNPIEITTDFSCTACELRDESKDKPFTFSAGVDLSTYYDLQKGTSHTYKFNPTTLKSDKGQGVMDATMGANLSFGKSINIFNYDLDFNFLIEKEAGEDKLSFSNYYVESKWFRFGQAPGNFNTYLPGSDRYAPKQIAFIHDLGDGLSYTVAIEQAQAATVRSKEDDEDANKAKKIEATVRSFKETDPKKYDNVTVETTKDEKEKDQLTTSQRFPQMAVAANLTYKQDWGNIGFSTILVPVEYYYGKKNIAPTKYENTVMYGFTLSSKYIFVHNENFNNKEETTLSIHFKFMNGLGGYGRENGGVPEDINPNFCMNKEKNKITAALQSFGTSLNFKQVWTENVYSSVGTTFMKIINGNEIIDAKEKYDNSIIAKITPVGFNIKDNFTLAPSYTFAMSNVIKTDGATQKQISRIGLALSYDF